MLAAVLVIQAEEGVDLADRLFPALIGSLAQARGGRVHEPVAEGVRQETQHLFRRFALGQALARLLQRLVAQAGGMLAQRADGRHRFQAAQLFVEAVHVGADHGLRFLGCDAPRPQVLLHHLVQVVDGEEVHVLHARHICGHVAGYRDVHDEQGPVLAAAEGGLHVALVQDGIRAAGGRDHDIRLAQVRGDLIEADGVGLELSRQLVGAAHGAVGDDHAPGAMFMQVARHELDGLTGADEQHRQFVEAREHLAREAHRRVGDGHGVVADVGLGAYLLGHGEAELEQPVQALAGSPGRPRQLVSVLDLAQDLRLAEDLGVEAAGNPEQVLHGGVALVPVEAGMHVWIVGAAFRCEPMRQGRAVFALQLGVDLGAVAGGEDDGFAHARQTQDRAQARRDLLRREAHALAHGDRGGEMADSEGEERHGGGPWVEADFPVNTRT